MIDGERRQRGNTTIARRQGNERKEKRKGLMDGREGKRGKIKDERVGGEGE